MPVIQTSRACLSLGRRPALESDFLAHLDHRFAQFGTGKGADETRDPRRRSGRASSDLRFRHCEAGAFVE